MCGITFFRLYIAMRIFTYITTLLCLPISAFAQRADTTAPASTRYADPNLLQQVFIGGNYRKTWSEPVSLPFFQLKTTHGGFKITELGGGMQTKSLRMLDPQGEEWALRTVDKDVAKAMDAEGIKSSFIRGITQDMISAAHPYGALITPPLTKALGILSTQPEVFFVPDDAAFGEYRTLFANKVCLLEKRAPVHTAGDKVIDTKKMYKHLKEGEYSLDRRELLLARLLDMLIGDWDRHGDQWKWEIAKTGDVKTIHPIPRDHDQALFHSSGLLIRMVRPFTLQHIIGYRKRSTKLKKLNRKEWYFDHSLLADYPEADWRAAIDFFQARLTDAVLHDAVKRLPPQIYARQGDWLYERLQSRRNTMMKGAMKYYRFLQTERAAKAIDLREAKLAKATND